MQQTALFATVYDRDGARAVNGPQMYEKDVKLFFKVETCSTRGILRGVVTWHTMEVSVSTLLLSGPLGSAARATDTQTNHAI